MKKKSITLSTKWGITVFNIYDGDRDEFDALCMPDRELIFNELDVYASGGVSATSQSIFESLIELYGLSSLEGIMDTVEIVIDNIYKLHID